MTKYFTKTIILITITFSILWSFQNSRSTFLSKTFLTSEISSESLESEELNLSNVSENLVAPLEFSLKSSKISNQKHKQDFFLEVPTSPPTTV